MSYDYQVERNFIFTEEGQRMFLAIRDHVKALLERAGAVRMQEAMQGARSGNSWSMLACVDRLVELKELREITGLNVAGQHRVFVSGSWEA